jgi:hypothetical protein
MRRRRGLILLLALALTLATFAGPAAAQPAPAPDAEARALISQGRFVEAAAAFETLFRETGTPKFLFNAALAREKAKQYGVSHDRWLRFLAAGGVSPDDRTKVDEHLHFLASYIRALTFVRDGAAPEAWTLRARLADDPTAAIEVELDRPEATLTLHDGAWIVGATADGYTPWEAPLDVFVGGATRVSVDLQPVVVAVAPEPQPPAGPDPAGSPAGPVGLDDDWAIGDGGGGPVVVKKGEPEPAEAGTPRWVWFTTLGVGGAAALGCGGLGVWAELGLQDLGGDPTVAGYADDFRAWDTRRMGGFLGMGAGLGLVAVGGTGLVPDYDLRQTLFWTEFGTGLAALAGGATLFGLGGVGVADENGRVGFASDRSYGGPAGMRVAGAALLGFGATLTLGSGTALLFDERPALTASVVPAPPEPGGAAARGALLTVGGSF